MKKILLKLNDEIYERSEKFIENSNGEIISFVQLVRHALSFYIDYHDYFKEKRFEELKISNKKDPV